MNKFWENFLIEIILFIFLGLIYYFYQRKKIIQYEQNKIPLIMGFILQSCLNEKKEYPEPQLDKLIESIDDYLNNKLPHPPLTLLKQYSETGECSEVLRDIILEGILEIEDGERKE